jgi:neuroligin
MCIFVFNVSGDDAPYPLVVWVHGESFEWNAGSAYDVSVLASLGHVIVITLNYRLGALGEFVFWQQLS